MRLAGAGISGPEHRRRPDPPGERPGPLLSRPPARAARVRGALGWRGRGPAGGRTGSAGVSRHRGPESQDHPLAHRSASRPADGPRRGRGPAGGPGRSGPHAAGRGAPIGAPPGVRRAGGGRPAASGVRRAAGPAADADPRACRGQTAALRRRLYPPARPHQPAQGGAPLGAHRRPGARPARDHRRHDRARPDAPPPHGRRGNRQDRRSPVRHAARGGERLPGRPHGSDRAAGGAARGDPDPPVGAARAPAGAAPGPAVGEPEGGDPRPAPPAWWSARTP